MVQKTNVVTQKQAKEWYDKATCSQRIGEGKFGETRWYNGAITPIGNYVAIKRFKDLTPTGRRGKTRRITTYKCGKTPAASAESTWPSQRR